MYLLKEIEKYTKGKIINGNPETKSQEYCLTTDNHKKGEFFIPILFKNVNREEFIIDAVKAGAIGFMINKNSEQYIQIVEQAKKINPNIGIVEVEDVNQALYQLGLESRRRNIDKPIIAVTGSVGKTTLCSLISNILKTEIKVLHDFENRNQNTRWHVSQLLMYFENYDMAVIELGISAQGIMTQLSKLVEPSIAVINNIGMAHINNLKNKETVLEEKLHITDCIKDKKILFVNTNDEYLQSVKKSDSYELREYNSQEAYDIKEENGKLSFKTKIYGKETEFHLNLYGRHHISNIALAIKIGEIYHIRYENIVDAINRFQPVDGRLKVLKNAKRNIIVIDDAYSCSSIEAVKLGLETANKMPSQRKIAVLGRMEALGEQATAMHEELGAFFQELNFDYLYTTGGYKKQLAKGATKAFEEGKIRKFKTTEKLIKALNEEIKDGDLIYVKGANIQCFDRIVEAMKEKYEVG